MWGEAWRVWGKIRGNVGGLKKWGGGVKECIGECGEVCWGVGKMRADV